MKLNGIVENWPKAIALLALTGFLFWGWACPPRVESLNTPDRKVTRPELQIELDTIIATAEYRLAELDKQQAVRDLVFQNALQMAENGGINPMGVITLLAGIYGITRGVQDVKNRVAANNKKTT